MLDNALQSGQGAPKWKKHSRLGVYLGPPPNHTRSLALVLSPRTGHVSPQFHIKFDDFIETVQDKSTDLDAPDSKWKYLSGFATKRGLIYSAPREDWTVSSPHAEEQRQQQFRHKNPPGMTAPRICISTCHCLWRTMKTYQSNRHLHNQLLQWHRYKRIRNFQPCGPPNM